MDQVRLWDDEIRNQNQEININNSYIAKMSDNKMDLKFDPQVLKKSMIKSKIQQNPYPNLSNLSNMKQKKENKNLFIQQISQKQNSCLCKQSLKEMICTVHNRQFQAKNIQKDTIQYLINFDTVYCQIIYNQNIVECHELILQAGPNHLRMTAQSKQIINQWKKELIVAIDGSKGQLHNMVDLYNNPLLIKTKFIPERSFIENCQTGDILLFKDSHMMAKVQRWITNSDFDHVALVINEPNYGIILLQANSATGVCMTPWNYLIKYGWYQAIQKIVWRRLSCIRNNKFKDEVYKFVYKNFRKKYNISFNKIMSAQSYIPATDEDVGYFCSELVAVLYKNLELLSRDPSNPNYKPACNFYPYHFTEKANLQLDKGSLSQEYQIHFNIAALKETYPQFKKLQ